MQSSLLPTGLGYVYSLDDEFDGNLAQIHVSQLRQQRGSIMALLTVSSQIKTAKRLPGTDRVTSAEVWLLSDRNRSSFASHIARLIPPPPGAAGIDWDAVLEDVCQQVVAAENRPLQMTRLTPAMASQTRFIIPGLVPVGKPTILYGAGGTGKSAFAACLVVAIETGHSFLGFPVSPAKTLYLDWETDEGTCAYRIGCAARGMKVEVPEIRYVSLVRPIEDEVGALATLVAEDEIEVVVIDSVGMAMADAKDGADASQGAIKFFRALRALNTSIIAIDHISGDDVRRGAKGAAKPYGSVYKWNSARNAFELRLAKDDDTEHLILKHRKSNLGPRAMDLHLTYTWGRDSVSFVPEAEDAHADIAPLHERIAEALVLGPLTPRQLTDLLSEDDPEGVNEVQVRGTLKYLLGDGKVTVMADGAIRLVKPTDEPVESGE